MQFLAQLVGNQFRQPEDKEAFRQLVKGDTLALVRDPANPYDANAIKVMDLDQQLHLGFIAKEIAVDLAPYLDKSGDVIAEGHEPEVTCTLYDLVDAKKPTLLIEVTTGYEVETEVSEAAPEGDDDEGED